MHCWIVRYLQGDYREAVTARLATREDLPVLLPLIDAAITELQKGFLDEAQIAASRAIMGIDTHCRYWLFPEALDLVIGLMF